MKKKQSDLVVGITIFIALILLVAGVLWLKEVSLTRTMVTYTTIFPNVGGLQTGDPVTVNGVKRGVISEIFLYESQVACRIRLDESVPFTDSAKVIVQNVGLMGERKIEISLNPHGIKHTPDGDTITAYINGSFDTGIAEAIGMLGNIMSNANGLLDTISLIISSTVGDSDFFDFFDSTVERLDSITLTIDRLLNTNEDRINGMVADLRVSSRNVKNIISDNKSNINQTTDNLVTISSETINLTNSLDSVLLQTKSVIAKVDTAKGFAGSIINDNDLGVELQSTLERLDTLITATEEQGLKLRVKLGFRDKRKAKKHINDTVSERQ